jgi:hypothetical protein
VAKTHTNFYLICGGLMMTGKLDDKEYLFAMLAALVKREGGELRISEEEISKLQTSDVIALLYDTKTGEVVLRVGDYQKKLEDMELSTVLFNNKADDTYEN